MTLVAVTDATTSRQPRLRLSLAVVCVCLTLGTISAIEVRHISVTHGFPLAWSLVIASTTPRWLLLAALLPFVLALAMRMPVVPPRARVIVLHVAIFIVLSVSQAVVDAWASGLSAHGVALAFGWVPRVMRAWYNTMPTMLSMYLAVLLTAWGMAEARERQLRTLRASQLEAQLHAARLASLRAQLQPHFLYNTLTGIAALVADVQPARAVAAIEQLGELLHASLRDDGRDEVTVTEEVGLAERYLALQRMRFGDRLRYTLLVSPSVADCVVPVLLLQPLVENAVVHGLDAGQEILNVWIAASECGAALELKVENDGTALTTPGPRALGHGVGISATRARLTTAYGDQATLQLHERAEGGVTVRVLLPRTRLGTATIGARERAVAVTS